MMFFHPDDRLPEAAIEGPFGKAWPLDLDAIREAAAVTARDDATIAAWLIEAPCAHPLWHSYWLTLFHLRPLFDGGRACQRVAGATHEMAVYAMNPGEPRRLDRKSHILRPASFASQIFALDDEDAIEQAQATVDLIVEGGMGAPYALNPVHGYTGKPCSGRGSATS